MKYVLLSIINIFNYSVKRVHSKKVFFVFKKNITTWVLLIQELRFGFSFLKSFFFFVKILFKENRFSGNQKKEFICRNSVLTFFIFTEGYSL